MLIVGNEFISRRNTPDESDMIKNFMKKKKKNKKG